jgi:hypothetical protein
LRLLAAGLAVVAGCSGRSSILTGGSSAGQLKTTISHLQFENEQLKTEVARLKEDNRSFEDRLVQEQVHNGDLAARLDDARNLLRDRGIDADTRLGAKPGGKQTLAPDDDERMGPRTVPAGRSGRKPRKPPAASLPGGDLDELPKDSEDDPPDNHTISLKAADSTPRRLGFADDPPHPANVDDDQLRWQPVATGNDPRATPRR